MTKNQVRDGLLELAQDARRPSTQPSQSRQTRQQVQEGPIRP